MNENSGIVKVDRCSFFCPYLPKQLNELRSDTDTISKVAIHCFLLQDTSEPFLTNSQKN